MPTPNRWSISSRACSAFAIVAAVGAMPSGWTIAENGNAHRSHARLRRGPRRQVQPPAGVGRRAGFRCRGAEGVRGRVRRTPGRAFRLVEDGTRRGGASSSGSGSMPAPQVVAFDNMGDRLVAGTEPWTQYRLALDVPHNASVVAFGVLLRGSGRAWADDLELAIGDERDVASTDMLRPDEIWRHLTREPAGLPRRPANLGFED